MSRFLETAFNWMILVSGAILFFVSTAILAWFLLLLLVFSNADKPLEKIENGKLFIRTKILSKEDDLVVTEIKECAALDCHMYVYRLSSKEVLLKRSEFDASFTEGDIVIVQLGKSNGSVKRMQSSTEKEVDEKVFPVLGMQKNRFDLLGLDVYILHWLFILAPAFGASSLVTVFIYKKVLKFRTKK